MFKLAQPYYVEDHSSDLNSAKLIKNAELVEIRQITTEDSSVGGNWFEVNGGSFHITTLDLTTCFEIQ